jgi:hypothetical protein
MSLITAVSIEAQGAVRAWVEEWEWVAVEEWAVPAVWAEAWE